MFQSLALYATHGLLSPPVDLVNSAGIPARPFRTDTLPIESFDFEEDAARHIRSRLLCIG